MSALFGWNHILKKLLPADIDAETRALSTIGLLHKMVDVGNVFNFSEKTTIASGASRSYLILTGAEDLHWVGQHLGSDAGPIDIQIFEDVVVSANGTVQTLRNRERNSSNVSVTSVYVGPTITTNGTQLNIDGNLSSATGGPSDAKREFDDGAWVFKPNSKYLVKLTNNDSKTATIWFGFHYFELITKLL